MFLMQLHCGQLFCSVCYLEGDWKAWQYQKHLVNLELARHSCLTHFVVSLFLSSYDITCASKYDCTRCLYIMSICI